MKITEMMNARNVIATLYREKLSAKLAYKFMKFINSTQDDEDFYHKKLQEILEEFGEKDEKGEFVTLENGGIKIAEDKQEDCVKEVTELGETTVETPSLKFSIDELDGLNLSMEEMSALIEFVEE